LGGAPIIIPLVALVIPILLLLAALVFDAVLILWVVYRVRHDREHVHHGTTREAFMIATIRSILVRTRVCTGGPLSLLSILLVAGCSQDASTGPSPSNPVMSRESGSITAELRRALHEAGFTGRVGLTLEARLGRPINPRVADLGRMLFFDPFTGLNNDNTCGGCH
jgi:hypothetical protein